MIGINFKAHLWKISRDHTDECTVILKVPASEALKVIGLPTETIFNVEVTSEEKR